MKRQDGEKGALQEFEKAFPEIPPALPFSKGG
jgi:hypothetical protein